MSKLNFSTSLPSQHSPQAINTFLVQKGTINVHKLSTRTNNLRSRFLPVDLRLETSINGILEASGGHYGLLLNFLIKLVNMTPVRSNGGQVYNLGHYYPQTPVSL